MSLYRDQVHKLKGAFSDGMGFGPEAFDAPRLTISTGPQLEVDHAVALGVGFGIGVGFNVEEAYLGWARECQPAKPYQALDFNFISALVAEGARRGERMEGGVGSLGFALDRLPHVPLPPGYEVRVLERGALGPLWQSGVFHNALGRLQQPDKFVRILWAAALTDRTGSPAALAGVWREGPGVLEIGVDVAREHRGHGLAPAVVTAATRRILDSGNTPFYSCGPANVRSQRTALASGFLPACSFCIARRIDPVATHG